MIPGPEDESFQHSNGHRKNGHDRNVDLNEFPDFLDWKEIIKNYRKLANCARVNYLDTGSRGIVEFKRDENRNYSFKYISENELDSRGQAFLLLLISIYNPEEQFIISLVTPDGTENYVWKLEE